jgi:hypothetical protein
MSGISGESIYNLIKIPQREVPKGPMYQSKFRGVETVDKNYSTLKAAKEKKPAATFGPAKVSLNPPHEFTKKRSKNFELADPKPFVRDRGLAAGGAPSTTRRPPIPARDERPLMGIKTTKNFVTANAVEAILSVPRKPAETDFDYTRKPDFGRAPAYLSKVKEEVAAEKDYVRQWQEQRSLAEQEAASNMSILSEEERQHLLDGMKKSWEALNKAYQTLSFSVDTPAKRIRKEEYEREMQSLEKDIQRLSRNYILVADK